jgi:hypothetical protein
MMGIFQFVRFLLPLVELVAEEVLECPYRIMPKM